MNEELIKKEELTDAIINGEHPIKDLTYIFNEAQIKASMLRSKHLSELQDKIIDRIDDRLTKKPDNFTNTELLNALNVVQNTQDRNTTYVNTVNEKPQIQLVSNNLNVTVQEEFDKESRDKIVSAVSEILKLAQRKEEEPLELIQEEPET